MPVCHTGGRGFKSRQPRFEQLAGPRLISRRGLCCFLTVTITISHTSVLASVVGDLAAGYTRGVDGTAGGGGHVAILVKSGLRVLAIDRDPEAVAQIRTRFDEADVTVMHGRFAEAEVLGAIERFRPDFALLDLGVSSMQLDSDRRGFSLRPGVALDMRMDPGRGTTAAEFLAKAPEAELTRVFQDFGDERHARRLAREIVRRRGSAPLAISDDLVNAIRAVLGPRSGTPDFARLFQAVRIAVNGELLELQAGLPAIRDALADGGTIAVLAYHSGEDRIVKRAFRDWARSCVCPPVQPVCTCRGHALGTVTTKKPIQPTAKETAENPRARSAKLRAFRKA